MKLRMALSVRKITYITVNTLIIGYFLYISDWASACRCVYYGCGFGKLSCRVCLCRSNTFDTVSEVLCLLIDVLNTPLSVKGNFQGFGRLDHAKNLYNFVIEEKNKNTINFCYEKHSGALWRGVSARNMSN